MEIRRKNYDLKRLCSNESSRGIDMTIDEDIHDLQFAEDKSLDFVRISENVSRIGVKAFYKCSNLYAIKILPGETPLKISLDFVKGCKNLVDITIEREVVFYKQINYRRKI